MNQDETIEHVERRIGTALKSRPAEWTADCLPPDQILKLVDRELPESVASTLMAHVALCPHCRREFTESVELARLSAEVNTLESAASPEIVEPFRAPADGPRPSFRRSLFSPGIGFAMGAAAAAAVLFFFGLQPARLAEKRLHADIQRRQQDLARANSEKLATTIELERLKQQTSGAQSQIAARLSELGQKVKSQEQQIARLDEAAAALARIPLPAPEWMARRPAGQLRGGTSEPDPSLPIAVTSPVNTAVETRRPVLEFRPLTGASAYALTLDVADASEAAPRLKQVGPTRWQPVEPLKPGKLYQWSVTAQRGGLPIRSRVANFYVLTESERQELQSERARSGGTSLALAALYARLGMMDQAARQFEAILKADPSNAVARRWLNEIPQHDVDD